MTPGPRTCLRHVVRSGDKVAVTVMPNDNRPDLVANETYLVSTAELRRFCWAVLADIDPDEAQAAALDEGQDLASLMAIRPRLVRDTLDTSPIRPGTKTFAVLQAVADGARTAKEIALRVPTAKSPAALLYQLRVSGFVFRADDGRGGARAVYDVTPGGVAHLAQAQEAA